MRASSARSAWRDAHCALPCELLDLLSTIDRAPCERPVAPFRKPRLRAQAQLVSEGTKALGANTKAWLPERKPLHTPYGMLRASTKRRLWERTSAASERSNPASVACGTGASALALHFMQGLVYALATCVQRTVACGRLAPNHTTPRGRRQAQVASLSPSEATFRGPLCGLQYAPSRRV